MRILLVSALLGLTASCAWPPPEAAAPPAPAMVAASPAPIALAPAPVAAPAPPPPAVAAAPPAPAVEYVAVPLLWARMLSGPPPAGRLMLNNFGFVDARVQAVLASGPDCATPAGAATSEFVVPPNGTRILPAPPGLDICWRRELPLAQPARFGPALMWTGWNRAFTGPGRFLEATL